MNYKQKRFDIPSYALFIDRKFDDSDDRLFAIERMDGWLDWKVCIFGLDLTIWIERTDR